MCITLMSWNKLKWTESTRVMFGYCSICAVANARTRASLTVLSPRYGPFLTLRSHPTSAFLLLSQNCVHDVPNHKGEVIPSSQKEKRIAPSVIGKCWWGGVEGNLWTRTVSSQSYFPELRFAQNFQLSAPIYSRYSSPEVRLAGKLRFSSKQTMVSPLDKEQVMIINEWNFPRTDPPANMSTK